MRMCFRRMANLWVAGEDVENASGEFEIMIGEVWL